MAPPGRILAGPALLEDGDCFLGMADDLQAGIFARNRLSTASRDRIDRARLRG